MKLKGIGLANTGIRVVLLRHLLVTILSTAVDANFRLNGNYNNIREQNQHHHHQQHRRHLSYRPDHSNLQNKDLRKCVCIVNGRQKLCGSPSCPCQKYSGQTCMVKMCSCLREGTCRPFYHPETGYSCLCQGDFTGFDCSVVDRPPVCEKVLVLEATDSSTDQKLTCFPKDGVNPASPCIDNEDDLVYTMANEQNPSTTSFTLRSEANETCLWFNKGKMNSGYSVTIIATEMDEFYSRPNRSDRFEVRVVLKTRWNQPPRFTNLTPSFLQFNFDNHSLQKGINFSMKAIDTDMGHEGTITYKLIDVSPKSFSKFIHLDSLSGDVFLLKPENPNTTREIVNISVKAIDGGFPPLSAIKNTKINLIFSSPLCQPTDSVWLYTSVKYNQSVIGSLHCLQKTGVGPFIFDVQRNNSGLNFMTKGPQLLASGTPPYPRGGYSLKLNVQDGFGDVGITTIPYIIAPGPYMKVKNLNFSTVEVSWQFSSADTINSYKLNISETENFYSFNFAATTHKQQINNLHPLKNYSFQIFAEVGNHRILVPSNIFLITTPGNVSAVCTPTYNGSFPSSDSALRCGAVFMKCIDPGKPDTRNIVYRFAGSFTQLSVKNVTCLDDECLFCFPKNSEGNYQLDITVENRRLNIEYSLLIHLHEPKSPICESNSEFFTISELAPRNSIVGRIKVKNPSESGTLHLTILHPVQWISYFYLTQDGNIHIRDPIDQLDNLDISLNLLASNRIGHCTINVVIHVVDENEPPSCNLPPAVHLMHPILKESQIVYLNCTDPDILQEYNQVTVSLRSDLNFHTQMFAVNSSKSIYAKTDVPLNLLTYDLQVDVHDSASPPGHRTYPLKLLINDTLIQKVTISFKITRIPSNNVFSDPNSDAYQEFTRNFTESISKIFRRLKGFLLAEFLRLRPGTTIADVGVTFDQHGQLALVKEAYISAVKNGFSNFSIDPNYIEISVKNHPESFLIEKAQQMSPLACVGCDVTYMCCSRPYGEKVSFHWAINGVSINNYSDKMELVGLRNKCDSCSGQSQCLTLRPLIDSANSTLSCEVSTVNHSIDYVVFNVRPEKPPQVILNSSSQYSSTGLEEEFIICSLSKPQDSLPVTFKWYLDSIPLDKKDARFQVKKRSAFSEILYIKKLTGFPHVSCKVCFGEGVPCSQSNVRFTLGKSDRFCPVDIDNQGRKWPETSAGRNQSFSCPENSTGKIVRMCDLDGHWKFPSQGECVDMSIEKIFTKLHEMKSSKTSLNKQASLLLESLSQITTHEEPLQNVKSLQTGMQALNEFVEISKISPNKVSNQEAMNFYQTASNLLSTKHKKQWDILSTKNQGVPTLMKVIGDFGNTIVNDLDNVMEEPMFLTENMDVQIGQTTSKDIIFPKLDIMKNADQTGKSNVVIPGKTLESFLSVNETIGYTIIYYKKLATLFTNETDSASQINQTQMKETVNSEVLAVTLTTKLPAYLDPPVELSFQHLQKNMINPHCSFWDFHSNLSGMGGWSKDGCKIKHTDDEMTVCACNHLTNFAVLMYPIKTNAIHTRILSYITIVGCSLTILGCILTLIAYACLWRYIRRHRATVLIHLCISLIIADIVFLAGIEQTSSKIWCTSIAVILHYFYLVVFFTMLAEGLDMAVSVTYVFATKSRTCYLLPMAWGIPAVIVGITMATTQLKGYGNPRFCWLSLEGGMIWAFVAPAAIILAINMVVIFLVFRAMFSTTSMLRKSVEEKAKSGAHGACVLLPVLGLTWLFGIFSVNKQIVAFQYLFALFNSMQGLLIFVFHCILNKQIRDAFWKRTSHLSQSSRTSSRSSPRFLTHETIRRLPSGLPLKTTEQGIEKSKNVKDGKTWSTSDHKLSLHKPLSQCYSLNVVLQCSVTTDPKVYSGTDNGQADQSPDNKECVDRHEPKTIRENRENEQRTVKFESKEKKKKEKHQQ